jgi:hypothetical protein
MPVVDTDAGGGSAPARTVSRVWRLLPSAGDVTLVALFGLLLAIPPYDTDVWWHLATGDWILAHRAVPRVDIFSFTVAGKPWVAHEWLADVGLALAWRGIGAEALALVQAMLIILTLAVLYRHASRIGLPAFFAAPLAAYVMILMLPAARPRPYLFTLLALAVLAYVLDGRAPRRGTYLFVAALFALWANVHAGWVLGLLWLAIAAAGAWWERRGVPWAALALLGVAAGAVLLNPHGAALLTYPLQYRAGSAHYRLIVEWASPDFHEPFVWLVELFLVAALALVVVRRPRGWRTDLCQLAVFGQLALLSVRNIPVLAVVAAPVMARGLFDLLPERWRIAADEPLAPPVPGPTFAARLVQKGRTLLVLDRRLQGLAWLALFVGCAVLTPALAHKSPKAWEPEFASRTADLEFPYAAAAHLMRQPNAGNVLNDYGWGGYLIWRLFPERRVFIDGRADVYGEAVLGDYVRMVDLAPGWDVLLERYDIRQVLLPPDVPLVQALRRACGWEVAFEDPISVLLSRPAGGVCP